MFLKTGILEKFKIFLKNIYVVYYIRYLVKIKDNYFLDFPIFLIHKYIGSGSSKILPKAARFRLDGIRNGA